MRHLRRLEFLFVLLAALLAGCTPQSLLVHQDVKSTDPLVIARNAIDQAYATHAAITATLLQNYKDGVITRDEKTALAAKTRTALTYLDNADAALAVGNLKDANAQAQLAQTIFTDLQLELAKQAKKAKGN
jgi:hypothetical protein